MTAQTTTQNRLDVGELLRVLTALRKGDFSGRMPSDVTGLAGKVYDTLNEIMELNAAMAREFEGLSVRVGKEGKIADRAELPSAVGGWASCVNSVNALVEDLAQPVSETARVIGAVARGDLSQGMPLEIGGRPLLGEFAHSAKVVNGMVEQLAVFSSEVIRVIREVGTEGKLGGQVAVPGVAGTWKDLTEGVNSMAGNLTAQDPATAESSVLPASVLEATGVNAVLGLPDIADFLVKLCARGR